MGSSIKIISAFCNIARARANFILQPPDNDEIGSSQSPPEPADLPSENPTFINIPLTSISEIPEFKIHFDDSDKNILQLGKQKMQYYSNFENHLRNNIGNDSSRLLIKNDSFHQLSDGKWRLNQNTKNVKSININTKKGLNNIRVTGTFYYPPGGMKEWHTNKTSKNTPDWRCYFIYLTDPNTESYFCYINPITGKFHKMRDKHMTFNIFYLNNDQERLLWHSVKCVKGGRMSFGFNLNPSLISGLMGRLNLKPQVG